MSLFTRFLVMLALTLGLATTAGCGAYTVGASYGDGYYDDNDYYYGQSRLPRGYFSFDDYYDGLRYRDYVCYQDEWYYEGYDTPYYSYWDDPYYW